MNRSARLVLLCLVLCNLCVAKSVKVWEPPAGLDFSSAKPTAPRELISSLQISGMNIILENTKLEAAQKQLGGTIGHRGDAGDSLHWLCLHGADRHGPWVVWLM